MLLPVWGWTARPCSAGSPPTGGWHRGVAGEAGAGPATAVVRGAAADAVHADRRCGPAAVRIPGRAVDPRPGPATDLHQVRCPVVGSVGGAAAADTGTVPPRPVFRASQQDGERVVRWREQDFPAIRDAAARVGATTYFATSPTRRGSARPTTPA